MKQKDILTAMGREDGDYIELHNQWAKVVISRDRNYADTAWEFTVSGDVITSTFPKYSPDPVFKTLAKAMAVAMHSLGEYQKGAYR